MKLSRLWAGWRVWLALALIVLLYMGLSLPQLHLPGLHYDEAFEAVPAVQLLTGQPVTPFRNSGLTIGGQLYPLMTQDYIGALNTYAALPFIAVLGSTPHALRLMSLAVGLVTLLSTFALARRLGGAAWVGLLAALLLAIDPTFIFWNRQGVFVTAMTAAIGVAAAYGWLRRLHGGSWRWSVAAAFLYGLGLYAKLLFLWLIFAQVGALLLVSGGRLWRQRADLPAAARRLWPEGIGVAAAFVLGCWPLLLYNWQTGGTMQNIADNAGTSYYGVNNLAMGANLIERLLQFQTLLNGGHLWYLGEVISNGWGAAAFALSTALAIATAIRAGGKPAAAMLWPLLVCGLVIVASIGTVSALWITHFALLMPWPALTIALSCGYVINHRKALSPPAGWVAGGLALVVVGLLLAANLSATVRYHQALAQSGGLSAHSDAVYDMSDWLAVNAQGPVVAMDWGLAAPVFYLTYGRVPAVEVFGYAWQADANLTARLERFIDQPEALYLWRSPDEIIFDRSQPFKALYRPRQLEETIEAAFYERSGRPILGVTRLVPQGTAGNAPK